MSLPQSTRNEEVDAGTPSPAAAATPQTAPRRRRRLRFTAIFGIWLLAVLGIHLWWGWLAESRLQAAIAAHRAAGEPVLIEDFAQPPIPDPENAAELVKQAVSQMVAPPAALPRIADLATDPIAFAQHFDAIAQHLRANAPALALVRQAAALDQADWHLQLGSPVITLRSTAPLATQRDLARLVRLAAIYDHQLGNDAEAFARLNDLTHLAQHISVEEPCLLTTLVSRAIDRLACTALECILPDLRITASQPAILPATPSSPVTSVRRSDAVTLIQILLDERGIEAAWTRGVFGERARVLDTIDLAGKGQFAALGTGVPAPRVAHLLAFLLRPAWKLDAVRLIDCYVAQERAGRAPDYLSARDLCPSPLAPESLSDKTARFLSFAMAPPGGLDLLFEHRAIRRMAATALAIRLFELDYGLRPAALDELVPHYLPHVPPDPFDAAGAPIRYLPDRTPPLLYSVSIDGVDDDGAVGLTPSGDVYWRAKDLPFYLNGDRPHEPIRTTTAPTTAPATTPPSLQAPIDDTQIEERRRNEHER